MLIRCTFCDNLTNQNGHTVYLDINYLDSREKNLAHSMVKVRIWLKSNWGFQ